MASTNLSDIDFNSNQFANTMAGEFTHRLAFLNSGVLSEVPENILSSETKGYFANIPHYDTLSGSSAQITSGSSTSVNSLATYNNVAPWIEREMACSADQLIKVVSGNDPAMEIAKQLAQYWAGEAHRDALQRLGAVFTTALATSHSTGSTYAGSPISLDGGIAAKLLLGDNQDQLNAVLWNSKVHNDALKDKIATVLAGTVGADDGYNRGMIVEFLGARAFQTDKLSAVSSVYPTYFAGEGAIAYKFRNRSQSAESNANTFTINAGGLKIEIERYRNSVSAGGLDYIISRASFFTHVMGTAWNSATTNPTDGQLATDSNWSKVATDDKLIKIVQLNTL